MRACKGFLPCEPTKAFYRVRAPRALRGASLQRLSTVYERQELCAVRASKGFLPCTSAKSFARCEPPKAFYRVRAPRALRGASLQKLCASVCCKSLTSYVRCEPTKAFHRVLVLALQDLLCARVQEPVHMYCLYELTRYLLFCTGTCMPECRGTEHSQELYNWYCS